MTHDTFTCFKCGGTFDKDRSDEDAMAAMLKTDGPLYPGETVGILCDDCYQEYRRWYDGLSEDKRAEMERERKEIYAP